MMALFFTDDNLDGARNFSYGKVDLFDKKKMDHF